MTENIAVFTPKSDDTFAAATTLIEVATVKPSGYLQGRGMVTQAEDVPKMAALITEYYTAQNRPEPVIYTRTVGTTEWVAVGSTELTIPDELPEDFA